MTRRKTATEIQDEIDHTYGSGSFKYILGTYRSTHDPSIFVCKYGHRLHESLSQLIRNKAGCPQCKLNEHWDKRLENESASHIKRIGNVFKKGYSHMAKCICPHGHVFLGSSISYVVHHGCHRCNLVKRFLKKFSECSNPYHVHIIDPFHTYKGVKRNVPCQCPYGHKFFVPAQYIKKGYTIRCQKCIEYRKCAYVKHAIWEISHHTLMVLNNPIGMTDNALVVCLRCHRIWYVQPTDIIRNEHGCRICRGHLMTDYLFRKRLARISHGHIIEYPVGQYTTALHGKVQFCDTRDCNVKWYNTPRNILRNPVSPLELRLKRVYHNYIFGKKLDRKIYKYHGHKLWRIGSYKGIHIPIPFKCWHGHIWYATPDHAILEGCPKCAASNGERYTEMMLRQYGFKPSASKHKIPRIGYYAYGFYLHSRIITGHQLHLDFLVNFKHRLLGIEVDGIQHFRCARWSYQQSYRRAFLEWSKEHYRDRLTTKYCRGHHIHLMRIKVKHSYSKRELLHFVERVMSKQFFDSLRVNKLMHIHGVHQMSLF